MEDIKWPKMLKYLQEFHLLYRRLLPQEQKSPLTSSEREILSLIYLNEGTCTPLYISRESGMKKEAVSRSLRQLFEKGLICKNPHPKDDRSHIISLTIKGEKMLNDGYDKILEPLYQLEKELGPDFDKLFEIIVKANERQN